MKASELMIGDWVYYENSPVQIKGIDFFKGEYVSFGDEFYPCKDFKPIPLTSEILEKNGWVNESFGRRQEWWLDKTKFPVVRYSTNDILHHNEIILKYVHQLQHALRLCEIEKEIVI